MRKPDRKHERYPAAQSIGHLVSVTSRCLQPVLEHHVRDQGVSAGTFFFLRTLWEHDRLSPHELSASVATSAPTTMAALRKLKAGGFISITDDPHDGRRLIAALTPKGRRAEEVLLARLERLNSELLRGLTRREVAQLRRMLIKVQANAATALSTFTTKGGSK